MTDESSIDDVDGVDDEIAAALHDAGYDSLADLRDVSQSDLYGVDGVDAALASKLVGAAKGADEESEADGDESQAPESSADGGSVESEQASEERETDEDGEETDDTEADVSDDETSDDGETEAEEEATGEEETETEEETSASTGLLEVRRNVQRTAAPLIGHELDGVIEVTKVDDGWRAVVEMVERHSVPDTQDILGQYELDMDDSGTVVGYRRISRYRRNEGAPENF